MQEDNTEHKEKQNKINNWVEVVRDGNKIESLPGKGHQLSDDDDDDDDDNNNNNKITYRENKIKIEPKFCSLPHWILNTNETFLWHF